MKTEPVIITVDLPESEAAALAQFVKRIGFAEMRANAVDDSEAYQIRAALSAIQDALNEAGFSPR